MCTYNLFGPQKIIACVRIAAEVMEHFAAVGRTTELAPVVQELCTRFMTTITVRCKADMHL